MDTVVRSSTPEVTPPTPGPDVPTNQMRVTSGPDDLEPIESRQNIVLDALGIEDSTSVMPEGDKTNLELVKDYVTDIVKSKGLSQTVGSFRTALNNLKADMGLDPTAEPSQVLDRIAGVVKAWRNLSFVTDPTEKKRIFMSLANLRTSSEMNRKVLDTMDKYRVWQ